MGSGLILPGALLHMALLVPSVLHGAEGRATPPDALFLYQDKAECRYANGTAGEVRFLDRHVYNRQEYVRFDSRHGWFEAVTELGEPDAQYWNSHKKFLDNARAAVDFLCRYNYKVYKEFFATRKAEPTVKISHTKGDPQAHHTLLICTAAGFYPSEIHIKWLKNGQEQTEGLGFSEKFQNGDWTFQDQVLLETVPERGDIYACQVEHSSVKKPITVQWEPRSSNSAQSKVWMGAVGAALGVALGALGVSFYRRTRPGDWAELWRPDKTSLGVLCSVLDNTTEERCRETGACPEEGYEDVVPAAPAAGLIP
ncbi:H-2 class II histocompatibility antigen, E-S beta chain-like isoform X5 [Paroedura picta]|uniref:H-2 class II histocompatibility antigen, E-S beta chain-like isoform X5 n=1 Tax=Paroedura picta TaxID=143630 RepID=UPI0040565F9E